MVGLKRPIAPRSMDRTGLETSRGGGTRSPASSLSLGRVAHSLTSKKRGARVEKSLRDRFMCIVDEEQRQTHLQAGLRAVRLLTLDSRILCAAALAADALAFASSHC